MFCTRCQKKVPDFLWIGNDHPVLVEKPMTIHRVDYHVENAIKVVVEVMVRTEMCSELFMVNLR